MLIFVEMGQTVSEMEHTDGQAQPPPSPIRVHFIYFVQRMGITKQVTRSRGSLDMSLRGPDCGL